MGTKRTRIVAAFMLFGLLAAACGDNGGGTAQTTPAGGGTTTESPAASPSETGEGGTITIEGKTANDQGTKDVSALDETELEMDEFYFEPTILQGSAGQQLQIELRNEGSALHNFSLADQGIDQDVAGGEDAT